MNKILLLFVGILISTLVQASPEEKEKINIKTYYIDDSLVFMYLDTISFYIDSLDIKEPKYVLAQTLLETGWFDCNNCAWSKGNNLFGFKGNRGYIKYSSWIESVHAYKRWQNRKYTAYLNKYPNGTYLDFLSRCGYSESSSYKKNVYYMTLWLDKNYYN